MRLTYRVNTKEVKYGEYILVDHFVTDGQADGRTHSGYPITAPSALFVGERGKNVHELRRHAFWYTHHRDLQVFIGSCRPCAEYHRGKLTKHGDLKAISSKVTARG
jgi:hypothetical protein